MPAGKTVTTDVRVVIGELRCPGLATCSGREVGRKLGAFRPKAGLLMAEVATGSGGRGRGGGGGLAR